MPSRRLALQLTAGVFVATSGCLGETSDESTTASTEATRTDTERSTATDTVQATGTDRTSEATTTDEESATEEDLPEWTPTWTEPFDDWTVLGVTGADGRLYATLQFGRTESRSAVAAVDPADGSVRWRTEMAGESIDCSYADYQRIARGGWGVTPSDGTVYTVNGRADTYEWTAVHALEAESGEARWSLRRERELAVAGVTDGLVVATGLEFFEPESTHDTPDEPLTTVVYGVDATTGAVRWTRRFRGVVDTTTSSRGVYVAAGDRLVALEHDGETAFVYEQGPATWVEATGVRVYYLTGTDETATLHGVAASGGADWTRNLPVDELLLGAERLYAAGDVVVAVEPDGTVAWRDGYGGWLLLDPDREMLYTRSGRGADSATAYRTADGVEHFTFDPSSKNAWPEAATNDTLAVTAITADEGPFQTVYAVDDDGRATAALGRETVFDAVGFDGTIYLADGTSELLALPT